MKTAVEWLIDKLCKNETILKAIQSDFMVATKTFEEAKEMEKQQQEISDEEIEKGAREWYDKEGRYKPSAIALKTWGYAIKWYREQLKQPKKN
jgi:hypothetical protein